MIIVRFVEFAGLRFGHDDEVGDRHVGGSGLELQCPLEGFVARGFNGFGDVVRRFHR